jgi:hypothetical protein
MNHQYCLGIFLALIWSSIGHLCCVKILEQFGLQFLSYEPFYGKNVNFSDISGSNFWTNEHRIMKLGRDIDYGTPLD